MDKEEITELLNDLETKFHKKQEASESKVKEMIHRLNDQDTKFDEIESKFKSEPDSHILDDTCGTQFHLQCVVAIAASYSPCNTRWGRRRKWFMGVSSLALVIFQFYLLHFLIMESSMPTCSRNMDCNIGEFCESHEGPEQPRCADCSNQPGIGDINDYDSCKETYGYLEEENLLVWISGDGKYHPDLNEEESYCVNAIHCVESNIGFNGTGFSDHYLEGHCDYLELMLTKVTWAHIVIFVFSAMLLGSILQLDINQCITEEKLFNYALAKENVVGSTLLVEIVRFTLRLRKFVLPWVVAGATATLILVSSLSVKNIMLNLLAIGFITEADTMLGKFFTTKTQKDLVNRFVDSAKQDDDVSFKVSFLWSRILALLPVTMMVVAVTSIKQLISFFENDISCDDVHWVIGYVFFYYIPFLIITVEGVVVLRRNKNKYSNLLQRIFSCMRHVSRNYNTFFGLAVMWNIPSALTQRYFFFLGSYSVFFVLNNVFLYLFLRPFDNTSVFMVWVLTLSYLCFIVTNILFESSIIFFPEIIDSIASTGDDYDDYEDYDDY